MISLLYEPLPCSVEADGKELPILTDFRDWVRFVEMIGDKSLSSSDKAAMMRLWVDADGDIPVTKELVSGLIGFCRAAPLEPDPREGDDEPEEDAPRKPPVFDYSVDARFLIGDFRRFYGIDLLRVEYLHWWEFKALFAALPREACSMERIGIRSCDLSQIPDKQQRRHILEAQRRIALPFEMEDEEIGAVFASMI